MSKTRDNSPELDYFELRRRHEEYKRARSAPQPEKNPVEERLERQVAQQKAKAESVVVEETPVNDIQDALDVEAKAAPMDAFEEAIEENYEAFEDDMDYDEEADEEAVNPNPFDSFIRFFNGMKSNRASRRQKDDDLEDLDLEDLTDEELAELENEDLADLDEDFEDEPAPAKPRFSLRRNVRNDVEEDEEEFAPAEDIEDLKDAPRPARKPASGPAAADEDFEDDDFEGLDDEDFDDEDFDDEDFEDEDDAPRKGGFKKFVNLFVARVDEDEDDEDYDDDDFDDEELEDVDFDDEDIEEIEEYEEEPARKGFFARGRKNKARHISEAEAVYDDTIAEIQIRPEGGQGKMEEMNKLAPETTAQADAIETSGMSRRERRERAMRLAAEEAARKAEEDARAKAEAAPVEPLFADLEVKQAPVDMAAFEDAPETDLIVETTAEEVIETVDEPTREFTPVSMRDVQEAAEKALFDVDDEDEDFDDEDEDEEDEDEIVEKKPRRGLFGRKRAKDEDEDDDDFDEDDEDEAFDDEDEDDEDEIVEKKPRRGLFGRKRVKDEDEDDDDDFDDEDEDEDDLDEDYDEEDDDDEYDEYDDDEDEGYDEDDDDDEYDDDDYDDDEDEPRRSFGHHLIGVFKIILGLILVLLVLVIGLNFHYFITGENAILEKTHEMLGDSSASDVLCFGYVMRETMPAVEATPEVAPQVETVVEPTALPQAEVAIPDLNNNGAITETPVVEAAPVIEAAPAVAEAPASSGSIG